MSEITQKISVAKPPPAESQEVFRVLILDDSLEQGEIVKLYLETLDHYRVDFTQEVDYFWQFLEKKNFDVIFLDYRLRNTTGLDILLELKQRGYQIPVIMMTGEGNEKIAAQSIQLGAMEYLIKGEYFLPGLPALITKAVNFSQLRMAVERSQAQIRYQSILLDNMRDAVVVWNLAGDIMFWNMAAEELYGISASERIGLPVQDFFFKYFLPKISVPDNLQMNGFETERRFQSRSEVIWINSRISPLINPDDGNRLMGYIDVARDITRQKKQQHALQQHQYFVQKIVDTTPSFLFIYDVKLETYVYLNPQVRTILGYSPEEIKLKGGRFIHNLLHPDDREMYLKHQQTIENGSDLPVDEIEYRMRHSNGSYRWLASWNTVFLSDSNGKPRQILGIVLDISDRKHMEEQLQLRLQAEELLSSISANLISLNAEEADKTIAENLKALGAHFHAERADIFLMSKDHESVLTAFTWQNESLDEKDYALIPGNLISNLMKSLRAGRNLFLVNLNDDSSPYVDEICQMPYAEMCSCALIPMTYNRNLIGFIGFGSSQSLQIEEINSQFLSTVAGVFSNALVHQLEEQALFESEARYRAIVEDHQTELICRFFPDGRLNFINEAFRVFFDQERNEIFRQNFIYFFPEEDRPRLQELMFSLTPANTLKTVEQRVCLADGTVVWHDWIIRAVFDDLGTKMEFQAVGRDITKRKMLEERVHITQARLAQATRLAAVGELASSVAHQIYNPLTAIIAETQILLQSIPSDQPIYESLKAIETAGWRSQEVVQKLMSFSQPRVETRESIDLNQSIQQALALVKGRFTGDDVGLELDLADHMAAISGNVHQMEDLWVNLFIWLLPAAETNSHKDIRILSRQEEQRLLVEVSCKPLYLPAEELQNIFEPQLLPPSSSRVHGMELSICREIVRQLSGEITVESTVAGTTFHISFPMEVN